jgi:hypothetical protein
MEIYLVNTHGSGRKYFEDEKSLLQFLNNESLKGENISNFSVKVVECTAKEELDGLKYIQSFKDKSNRAIKLNAVLGDEFSSKVEKFKTMFSELAKDDSSKIKFKSKLDIVSTDKKALSRLFTTNVGYLFSVDTSVDWYKTILDIHNFKKIEDFYVREVFYSNGTSRYQNVKVPDLAKENFNKAKSLR